MDSDDRRLEAFLRQFQLREPAPFLLAPAPRRRRLWMGAAAAALVLASAAAVYFAPREDRPRPIEPSDLTVAQLAQRAGWDIDALDKALSEVSPRVLPDVERPESVLKPLSGL